MREAARRLFDFDVVRRPLSVAVLILIDAAALTLGVLVAAYLVGGVGQEVVAYLPVLLAVGLALFAAHDLYDRAAGRRNPWAFVGALMWWAGLLVIGSVVIPGAGWSWEVSCSRRSWWGVHCGSFTSRGSSGSTAAAPSGYRRW